MAGVWRSPSPATRVRGDHQGKCTCLLGSSPHDLIVSFCQELDLIDERALSSEQVVAVLKIMWVHPLPRISTHTSYLILSHTSHVMLSLDNARCRYGAEAVGTLPHPDLGLAAFLAQVRGLVSLSVSPRALDPLTEQVSPWVSPDQLGQHLGNRPSSSSCCTVA